MTAIGTGISSSQAVISLRSYMNPIGATQQNLVNQTTPDSFTADASAVLTMTVAPATSNSSFSLATLFAAYTAPVFVAITDTSNPGIGFKITTNSGSDKMGVAANGWFAYMADGTTALPTVFIDNPSATQTLYLSFALMTQ